MGIRYQPVYESIGFAGGELSVRGLNLMDITKIVNANKPLVEMFFNQFSGRDPATIGIDDSTSIAMAVLQEAPLVAAHVIALAADQEDAVALVSKLPASVQVDALERIARLTFVAEGGPKKVLEIVTRAMAAVMRPARLI